MLAETPKRCLCSRELCNTGAMIATSITNIVSQNIIVVFMILDQLFINKSINSYLSDRSKYTQRRYPSVISKLQPDLPAYPFLLISSYRPS